MSICEKSIIEFLTREPDFLVRNPDLLSHLVVPHGIQGNTVSLLEYQSNMLRERLRRVEEQYQCENLRGKFLRKLSQQLNRVVLQLCESGGAAKSIQILEAFLIEYFSADIVRVYAAVAREQGSTVKQPLLQPLDPWRRGLFTLVLNNRKPLCDSLQHEHLVALFAKQADHIHSTLLVPFVYCSQEALLAVGSSTWQKYKQSIELDILVTVIEIISHLSSSSLHEN